jgi:adenylyltransferase/sulfurtransferase
LYLAAAGVGQITVVDGDKVELSNLQRQIAHFDCSIGQYKAHSLCERMTAINPLCHAIAVSEWLNEDNGSKLVAAHDVVVDCCDNFATRFLINRLCVQHQKPLVSGAAIRGEGQLAVFIRDQNRPCYACLYPEQNEEGETCAQAGVLAPVVGVIACLQATETIKVLVGKHNSETTLTVFDAWQTEFRRLKVKRDPHCSVCSIEH